MDMGELMQCPFDINHRVSRRRFQYHISSCVKTYTGRKVPCPYNATEYLYPEEFEEHFKWCTNMGNAMAPLFPLNTEREEEIRQRMIPAPFFHPHHREPTQAWGLDPPN